jgi:ribosomal-protein-serine acetyltransferase
MYMFRYVIGQDLELRLLEERHATELFKLTDTSREFLRPWTPWIDSVKTADDSKAFIRHSLEQFSKGEGLTTGIWKDGVLTGVISFDRISQANRSAMIGYWIGAKYQRKGLMTRACNALIDYGFKELNFNRIEIWAATENLRSLAIPIKLGFAREGVGRQVQWLNDRFVDIVTYSMLQSEWKSRANDN